MIDKQKNLKKALAVKEIAQKYKLLELEQDIDDFIKINDLYKVHILMIGGYSAGKSALLNKYIGKNILRENQAPETDIATELYFSENECIIANMRDGSRRKLSSIDEEKSEDILNIEYYVDSENIKTQYDYIMVDTPGVDSGIEKHNKALMQYIDNGTVFFLVIDCENGTISESNLKFMNEITNYSSDIAVIINKCDKKTQIEIEEIKEHIEDLLEVYTGMKIPLICTSIYDDMVEEKIISLIKAFNPQYLYDKRITAILEEKCELVVEALKIIQSNEKCDVSEIEEEICKRKKAKERLIEEIEIQKKKMRKKLHNEIKENILLKINTKLIEDSSILAESYKSGIDMFQSSVIDIIRPIIISELDDYSSVIYKDVIKNIDYNLLDITDSTDDIVMVVKDVYGKLKDLNDKGLEILNKYNLNESDTNNNGIEIYTAISSILAIITDVVAPPLELIIVFLPEIMKLVGTVTGTTKEQKLIDAIQNKVIPQIIMKLRLQIEDVLLEIEDIMAENIVLNIQEIIDIENSALEIAIDNKNKLKKDYSEFIKSIDEDIDIIRK